MRVTRPADLLIAGGELIDGSGAPRRRADVAVRDGRVVAIGDLAGTAAAERIDATGRFLCPGFIDLHAHSDLPLLADPGHAAKVHQGVTLEVIGQDGLSFAPVPDGELLERLRLQLRSWNGEAPGVAGDWRSVADYLARLDGAAVNVAYLIPHGTLRIAAVGDEDRPATERELAAMRRMVAEGIADGAVGLSAGLTYAPGMYAPDAELVALCATMTGSGGYYCPHHRDYGAGALRGYADSIEIGRAAGVPVHLTHANMSFPVNRGRGRELVALVDRALADGLDVTLDTYPYFAGTTSLHAYLPSWVHVGGPEAAIARLRDPGLRERLRRELEEEGSDGHHGVPIDWAATVVSGVELAEHEPLVGRSVAALVADGALRPIDLVCDLLARERLGVMVISHVGNEADQHEIMRHPMHAVGSDGMLVGQRPHPRAWGTFPRFLLGAVREWGGLSWEEAVRRVTSLPARRLGLADRGTVAVGAVADLVCLDPATLRDRATYEQPCRLAEGIGDVIVGGRAIVRDGVHTGDCNGRALRRGAR